MSMKRVVFCLERHCARKKKTFIKEIYIIMLVSIKCVIYLMAVRQVIQIQSLSKLDGTKDINW